MTPRRDVEGEIYAQLYGEPSEPEDPGATRVIDGDHRTRPVREDPEPEPPRPRALEALGLAAVARVGSVKKALRSARAQGLRDAVRSTRAPRLRESLRSARAQSLRDAVQSARGRAADRLRGREGRAALGALAAALVGLVLVAGLSSGSGEPQRVASPPPGAAANELAAESAAREAREARKAREAREAREARRRKARRRRATAQRRREERATATAYQAPAEESSPSTQDQTTDGVCSEDAGCVPQSSRVRRPTSDDEDAEQSDRQTVRRPRVRIDFRYGRTGGGERYVRDVDVDVAKID